MIAVIFYTVLVVAGFLIAINNGRTKGWGEVEETTDYPVAVWLISTILMFLMYWWLSLSVSSSPWFPVVVVLAAIGAGVNLFNIIVRGRVFTYPLLTLLLFPLSFLAVVSFWGIVF